MSTALTEAPQQQPKTIKQRLQSPEFVAALAEIVPSHCKPERMARIAITALTRTPALAECDQSSFFRCLMDLSQWGLEPDGRRAHLIPYRNNRRNCVECNLIIDYKGYVELAYRSGVVQNIHADVVRDGDVFDYSTGRVTKHVPWFLRRDAEKPSKAGEVFAAYCVVELKGGTVKTEVLSHEDIEGIRKRSKAGNSGPWVTDWCEMAKKTAFRRATKWLPLSAEIRDAFERDDDVIEGIATPRLAHQTTVDDLAALLKGGNDEHDETSQGDAHDGIDRPSTTPDVDPDLIDLARMDFAAETEPEAVDFAADKLIREKQPNAASVEAINGLRRERKAELAKPKGKQAQKSLAGT